jgi:hypothetical protein
MEPALACARARDVPHDPLVMVFGPEPRRIPPVGAHSLSLKKSPAGRGAKSSLPACGNRQNPPALVCGEDCPNWDSTRLPLSCTTRMPCRSVIRF